MDRDERQTDNRLSIDRDAQISVVVNSQNEDDAIDLGRVFHNMRIRRRIYAWVLLLCLAALLSMTACGSASAMEQKQIFAMDTVMTLTAYGSHATEGLDAATSIINSMEALLDPELPTSTTYAINHANGANIVVNAQIAKMLSTAKTVYEQSDGALDLSLYPVVKLWGFVDGRYYVPLYEEIQAQLSRRAFDKMILTSYPATGSYSVSFPAGPASAVVHLRAR